MIPHLLAIESKRRSISKDDKEKWSQLAKTIRTQVTIRYVNSDASTLWEDLQFPRYRSKKAHKNSVRQSTKPMDDPYDFIVGDVFGVNDKTIKWIKEKRAEKLLKPSRYDTMLVEALAKCFIKAELKTPFIVGKSIYFSDVYIPKYRTAINIVAYRRRDERIKDNDKKENLKNINVRFLRIYTFQASDMEFVREFAHALSRNDESSVL